jgi:hypothetical protein
MSMNMDGAKRASFQIHDTELKVFDSPIDMPQLPHDTSIAEGTTAPHEVDQMEGVTRIEALCMLLSSASSTCPKAYYRQLDHVFGKGWQLWMLFG